MNLKKKIDLLKERSGSKEFIKLNNKYKQNIKRILNSVCFNHFQSFFKYEYIKKLIEIKATAISRMNVPVKKKQEMRLIK